MLIKALCEYSDMLSRKGENNIPPYASEQKVHYMIYLTADGEISGIADIRNRREIELKNDKKKPVFEPRTEIFPKRSQKPGIDINIVEHRPLYIFGLNYEKGVFTTEDKTNKARKSHECFVNGNLEFCKDLTSELAKAYCAFIEKWNPVEQTENPHLLELGKEYSTSYFCFALDGHPEAPLNRDSELVAKYAEQFAANTAPQDND